MLLNFRISNYRSIKDEQELSLISSSPGRRRHGPTSPAASAGQWDTSVGTVVGIYGANASGKSNLLNALEFMRTAVVNSHQKWSSDAEVPLSQFRLDPACYGFPSLFEVNVKLADVRYQYGFRITPDEVSEEWLYAYPGSRRQTWFERERDQNGKPVFRFGKNFAGQNRTIAELTRSNSLFLSAGVANNHRQLLPVYQWFSRQLRSASADNKEERTQHTLSLLEDPERANEITQLVRHADLGISDIHMKHKDVPDSVRARAAELFRAAAGSADDEEQAHGIAVMMDTLSRSVEFEHSTANGLSPVSLPLGLESLGTQALVALAGPLLEVIADGETLLVDELDASMHPQLTAEILRAFQDPARNPNQAQLIFTTHDTTLLGTLLGERELDRDQVWFTEKRSDGSTVVYPLTDFSPRKAENLERGYLQGRYGAVPVLAEPLLPHVTGTPVGPADEVVGAAQ